MSEPPDQPESRGGFFVRVVPALLYVATIFYGGLMRPGGGGPAFPHADKALHAIAFGMMQVVVLRALRYLLPGLGFRKQNLGAFALVVAAGGLLELAQLSSAFRSAEWLDLLADAVGAGLVALVFARRARRETCAGAGQPES